MKIPRTLLTLALLCAATVVATAERAASTPEETAMREAHKALEKQRAMLERERAVLERHLVRAGTVAQREHRIDVSAEALKGRLTLTGVSGDILIEGTDEPVIIITGDVEDLPEPPELPEMPDEPGRGKSRPTRAGLRSLLGSGGPDNSGLGLEIKAEGSNINIVAVRPHEEGDYRFRVPRTMAVVLAGALRGDMHIVGMQAEIEAVVPEGDITLDGVRGPLVVQGVNGDVSVRFSALAASGTSSVNSVNGTVDVTLPADAAVTLDLMTVNGDILTDLPIEVKNRKVVPWGGPRSLRGTLNGGGVELKINSINDDIILRGAGPAPAAAPAPAPAPAPTPAPAPPKSGK
jgi:hypothetical protein